MDREGAAPAALPTTGSLQASEGAPPVVEGHLDGLGDGQWRGWAYAAGHGPLVVEAHVDGRLISRTTAGVLRDDLVAAGKGDGQCAFSLPWIGPIRPGQCLHVVARVPGFEGFFELHGGTVLLDAAQCDQAVRSDLARQQLMPDVTPIALHASPDIVGFIDHVGRDGRLLGWVYRRGADTGPLTLEFLEDGICLFTAAADVWRKDVAALRQGEGSCGIDLPLPDVICDGRLHELQVRLAGTSLLLTGRPIRVRPGRALAARTSSTTLRPAPLVRAGSTGPCHLSVVVVFYNMHREATRTLTSLSSAYQQGVADLDYEVICVDNGSEPPLEAEWVASFGPQFRLFRPTRTSASPCAAINEAALQARGTNLAIMIDGAHVLTPGVIREAMDAMAAEPDAVVAVRHWFVGGDQRWLSTTGYSREMEDRLFRRIAWPRDGYRLFRVGAPITESPEPWFDWLNESNCLFLPTTLFDDIGGMDEAFDEPGGGFANLDLAARAGEATPRGVICLVGEASFHQFHHGTTTNVDDSAKDAQVRSYAGRYRRLRGKEFKGIDRNRLRFRGSIRNDAAIATRQRPLQALTLGVTDGVRLGNPPVHLDEGMQEYLQSAYAECGMYERTRWMGHSLDLAPSDLINLENLIGQVRPECIVAVRADMGLLVFLESLLALHGLQATSIVRVGGADAAAPSSRAVSVVGSPRDPETLRKVTCLAGAAESTLVLFRPDPGDDVPTEALAAYSRFVSFRSYLVFLGTVFGQPWLGYSSRWYRAAINEFVAHHPAFVVERSLDSQVLTLCAGGYLCRVGDRVTLDNDDPSLDCLDQP